MKNPPLTLFEGNTYVFKNKYWNGGQHQLELKRVTRSQIDLPNSTDVRMFSNAGDVLMASDGVSGMDTDILSITITSDTPDRLLLVDKNYPDIKCVLDVQKIQLTDVRPDESFDMINNPAFLVPDNYNNIWFSWGNRFVSRYNVDQERVDTTLAVGSAFDDPRYHDLDPDTYDRRDNAGRRSAIEGIGMDTANNLLVINNADKRIYAMNSDTYVLSAFVNIESNDVPYDEFNWVPSISSNNFADKDTFMLYSTPSSYMTEEQMLVFMNNANFSGTEAEKLSAYNRYHETIVQPGVDLRTAHGAEPVSATGFESIICAHGDWTGYNWINKYDTRIVETDETTGFISVTGESNEFEILPRRGTHEIVKVNESNDFAGNLRSFMKQSNLRNSTKLYNEMMNSIFGTIGSDVNTLGKRIYEKIANYIENHNDIDTCTIDALQGMAEMVNYNLMQVQPSLPADLQRLIDVLSVNFSKLRGHRSSFQQDFENFGNYTQEGIGVNLGPEIIIVKQWMAGEYKKDGVHIIANRQFDKPITAVQLQEGQLSVEELFSDHVRSGLVTILKGGQIIVSSPINNVTLTLDHHSYETNDYVMYEGEYYESRQSVPIGIEPGSDNGEYWQHWPDGNVRSQSYERIDNVFRGLTREEKQDKYEKLPIVARLRNKLRVDVDKKLVFREEHTNKYSLVSPMVIGFNDGRDYGFELRDGQYLVDDPNTRSTTDPEYLATFGYAHPIFTIGDNTSIVSLIGTPTNPNPTINLFRNRVYRFQVSSPGHPMIITTTPGLCADLVDDFVTNQRIENGEIIIDTKDHPVYGSPPEHMYYQSVTDPKIGGKIKVTDVQNAPHYSTQFDGLTSYELDLDSGEYKFINQLGWGLSVPSDGNVWQFYSMYEYLPNVNKTHTYTDNTIEWNNSNESNMGETTVSFETSAFADWVEDGGIMDIMFEKQIREGLQLFDGIDSINTYTGDPQD